MNRIFIEKWKNDINKEKLSFTDGHNMSLSINANRFQILKNIEVGQVVRFKLHNKLVEDLFSNRNVTDLFEDEVISSLATNQELLNDLGLL